MPKRYTENPFAQLGVPRDCAKPDREPAVKQRRMELKLAGKNDDALRTALQSIENPQARLRHEIFWPDFDDERVPADFAQDRTGKVYTAYEQAAGDDLRSAHNLAILTHAQALAAEAARDVNGNWPKALERWHGLCERKDFWEFLGQRVVEFADARLRIDELETLKREVPQEVLAPAGVFAAGYLSNGKADRAKRLFDHVEASGFDRLAIDDTLAKACAASVERVDSTCEKWEEVLRTLEDKSKAQLEMMWAELRDELVPPVKQLLQLEPHQPRGVAPARDRAAKVLRNYAVNSFNAKRCHDVASEGLGLARELAASEAEAKRIRKDQGDLATTADEDKCAFCAQPARGGLSEKVYVHRIQGESVPEPQTMLQQFHASAYDQPRPRSVRYNTITFQVPRCGECEKIHAGGSSETHQKQADGCGGCVLALAIPAAVLGFFYWQTEVLDAWDYASGVAIFAFVMTLASWSGKSAERTRKQSNRPTTRPWSVWTEWPQAADVLARGYIPGEEPTQEQIANYLNGNHSTYAPDPGSRTCRSCGHKTRKPKENCPNCGSDRMAAKSLIEVTEKDEGKKADKGSPIAAAFWLLLLIAIIGLTLRPTRREAMWRLAKHRDTPASYLSFLRQFPVGKYSAEANAVVDVEDWAEAEASKGYWDYLIRQPRGQHVKEALKRLHAEKPWKGAQLVHAIEMVRREIGANVVIEEFLWERVKEEDTTKTYLAFARTHKSYERRESAMTREAERRADERSWTQAEKIQTLSGYRGYLSTFPKGIHVAEARQNIKDRPWFEAKKRNTTSAYKNYLRRYPRSKYAAEARDKLDDLAWASAAKSRRLSSIQHYLRTYPRGRHRADAHNLLDHMLWTTTKRSPTVHKYREYLRLVPRGLHMEEARKAIDDLLWSQARSKNTVAAYRNYLSYSPAPAHKEEAEAFMRDAPWYAVMRVDTESVYRQFIAKYPNSPRVADARKRIDALRWEQALRTHTEVRYTAFLADHPDNSFAADARRIRDSLRKRSDPIRSGTSAFLVGPKVKTGIDMRELKTRKGTRRLPLRFVVMRNPVALPIDKVRMSDRDMVIGVTVNGYARAYPFQLVYRHHVVNDVLGGVPIAVHNDWLSGAIGAFDRRVGDRVLLFAPTKHVYRNAAVHYDTETETFWNPVRSEGIVGALTGATLTWVSSDVTTWALWRKRNPNTQVAKAGVTPMNYRPSERYERWTLDKPPYPTGPHTQSALYSSRTFVQMLRHDGKMRGYPMPALERGETSDGEFNVSWTKDRFDVTRAGRPVPTLRVYWTAWRSHAPDGTLYKKP